MNPNNTQGANSAMTNLGFANNMLHDLMEYKNKGNPNAVKVQSTGEVGTDKAMTGQDTSSQTVNTMLGTSGFNPQAAPAQAGESGSPEGKSTDQKDTSGVEKLISDLQATHDKEITQLRSEISTGKMKAEYQTKIDELEKTHKQEITNLQSEIKQILKS